MLKKLAEKINFYFYFNYLTTSKLNHMNERKRIKSQELRQDGITNFEY